MKIGIVIHSMASGGAERVSGHLANYWSNCGVEIHLITMLESEADFYPLRTNVVRHALGLASDSTNVFQAITGNLTRILALRRVLKRIRPDFVIGMMTGSAVTLILASRGLDFRVIVSERTHPPCYPVGRMWGWLRQVTYPWADRVVMLTEESLGWLKKAIPKARGVVIPNPVIYPLTAGEPVIAVDDDVQGGRRLLLAVGRLDEGKQFDCLLEAFSRLVAVHSGWDLRILGEGPARGMLQDTVSRLGLEGRVRMPGRVGNVGDWYARADIYVMSSRFEGFPNTLVEAMAYGCAAVSFDCDTGPRDIIRHGVDGLLVRPVGDAGALAEALGCLMNDEAGRKEMGNRAIEVRERFSPDRVFCFWQSIVEENKRRSSTNLK